MFKTVEFLLMLEPLTPAPRPRANPFEVLDGVAGVRGVAEVDVPGVECFGGIPGLKISRPLDG